MGFEIVSFREELPDRSISRDLFIASATAIGLVLVLCYIIGSWFADDWWPFNASAGRPIEWGDVSRIAVPGAALVLATVTGVMAVHAQMTRTHELKNAEDAAVTDRYVKAIEHLGHDNVSVRVGGAYALERIALDSVRDCRTICRVLAEHVRSGMSDAEGHADAPENEHIPTPADVHACLRALGTLWRLRRARPNCNPTFDLAKLDARRMSLDGADLAGANLRYAALANCSLVGATLDGADLRGADLAGAKLTGAGLAGANLTGADLRGADLTDAELVGAMVDNADLTGTVLTGTCLTRQQDRDTTLP